MSRDLSSCTLSGEKQNVHKFNQIHEQGKWKNIIKQAVQKYQKPCQTSMMEQLTMFAESLHHRYLTGF